MSYLCICTLSSVSWEKRPMYTNFNITIPGVSAYTLPSYSIQKWDIENVLWKYLMAISFPMQARFWQLSYHTIDNARYKIIMFWTNKPWNLSLFTVIMRLKYSVFSISDGIPWSCLLLHLKLFNIQQMHIYTFVDFCHVLSNATPKSMSAQGVTSSFTQSIGSDLRRESGQTDFVPTWKSKWPMKCEVDLLFVISHPDKWKAPPPLLCLLAFCQHYKLQIGISWKAKQITTDLTNNKGNHGRTMKRITILVMDSLDCWANKWEQKYLSSANL